MAYGVGLRANEVISLKVADIDSRRMIICVEQGKGDKDRNVMISLVLLDPLRPGALRYPPAVANRQTTHGLRRHPPLIRQPLRRRTTRCIGSIQIRQLARVTALMGQPPPRSSLPACCVSAVSNVWKQSIHQ